MWLQEPSCNYGAHLGLGLTEENVRRSAKTVREEMLGGRKRNVVMGMVKEFQKDFMGLLLKFVASINRKGVAEELIMKL